MSQRSRKASAPLRRALKQHTRAAYHEAIMSAASAVFSRVGFLEAKMADIAAEAGVSVGTLYNYFRNKDDVIGSLVTHEHAHFRDCLSGVETITDPVERIGRLVETSFRFLDEHGALLAMAVQAGVFQQHVAAHPCSGDVIASHQYVLSLYETAIELAVAQGRIHSRFSPARLALALDGIASSLAFQWVRTGQAKPLAPQAEFVFELFMKGAACK